MNISNIKALSVAGPFPWLIASGRKQIEIRSWRTNHSGAILIHASSGIGYEHLFSQFGLDRKDCPKFAIIGAAKLKTCIQYNSEKLWESHQSRHCWDEGYQEVLAQYGKFFYGHIMIDPILFDKPILDVPGAFNYWLPKNEKQKIGFEGAIAQLKKVGYLI